MKCPFCGNSKTKVIDSRSIDGGAAIRRRRRCSHCGSRFTTFERREKISVVVIKRNGEREPYERRKLAAGMYKACSKRNVSAEIIDRSINEIEERIMKTRGKEIKASEIGDMVMEKLKEIDEVAYLRFASVYKRFGNVREFQKELGELMPEQKVGKGEAK
ncbi:MAG: transcriptional regulator NrdR [Actinomycetota bacterium]|nr:transcriptional regulator NrdR [Actinomycetota bacterium]